MSGKLVGTLVPEVFFRRKETRQERERNGKEKTFGCRQCKSHYHARIGVMRIDKQATNNNTPVS